MKRFSKNFIAFTLSEMMIVLLIISVISAATLPAITSRDESQAGGISASTGSTSTVYSNWMYDSSFTKGFYYKIDKNHIFSVGKNIGNLSASQMTTTFKNNNGSPTLVLWQTQNKASVLKGSSDIVLLDKDSVKRGSLGFDRYANMAIGYYAGVSNAISENDAVKNVVIGTYAGNRIGFGNTLIGAYAGYIGDSNRGTVYNKNVVVGSSIRNYCAMYSSVVIGSYASSYCIASNNTYPRMDNYVGIGAYSGHGSPSNNFSGVNIGYYAGARKDNVSNYAKNDSLNAINIGAYSGYNSSPNGYIDGLNRTDPKINQNTGIISIGYWAGSEQYVLKNSGTKVSGDGFGAVNIGAYAGHGSVRGGNVNIGRFADYNNSGQNSEKGDFKVNIGEYAGASTTGVSVKSVNIGTYAGRNSTSPYSINIGVYAGGKSNQNYNVNIGAYAGWANKAKNSIFIGNYAGAYVEGNENIVISSLTEPQTVSSSFVGNRNVFIGCLKNLSDVNSNYSYRFCLGGQMPVNSLNGNSKGIWVTKNAGGTYGYTYQMLFTPAGIRALSSIGFKNTIILLYARYVVLPNGTMYAFSDRRLKENIKPTQNGIDKLRKVVVYQYNMIGNSAPHIGIIAQQLMKVFPYAVEKAPEGTENSGYLYVNNDWLIFSLAQSIKDVDKMTVSLTNTLSEQMKNMTKLSQRVDNLENKLDRISKSNQETKKQLKEMESITKKWSSK